MPRVLIVNMPFANPRWPAIGPSLLQAALRRRGMACDAAYFNFDFAERIGLEQYDWIADHFAFVLGGERLFARHYFGDRLPDDDRYWRDVLLAADPELSGQDRLDFERIQHGIEPFLDDCTAAVEHPSDSGPPDGGPPYDVVGFTASFQQTMPSLCLARRIKRLRPATKVVFGGAACEAEMGVELLRQFECIDYVFLGEADLTFPAVVEQLLQGGPVTLPPGVVGRGSPAASTANVPGKALLLRSSGTRQPTQVPATAQLELGTVVRDLDALPYPDFDDYFARHAASPLRDRIDPLLFFETSRGCWWGEKHHCVFCGLNGRGLAFRSKSPRRAVDEYLSLALRSPSGAT